MKVETYKCDECGKLRSSDSNHWLIVIIHVDPRVGYWLGPWDITTCDRAAASHLCGEKCAHATLDRFMASLRTGSAQKNLHSTIDIGTSVS